MIEILVATRILSDFFWEYKLLSVLSATLFTFCSALFFLIRSKIIKITGSDLLFFAFILLATLSDLINTDKSSTVELGKLFAYWAVYVAGRVGPAHLVAPNLLSFSCFATLIAFSATAAYGVGYQDWGGIITYSGGYFFKTDMAMSALILLAILSSTATSRSLIFLGSIMSIYLILKTNARIAVPLSIVIPLLATLLRSGYINKFNIKAVVYFGITTCIGMALFLVIDFEELGLLGFDFSKPFSPENTQGRSEIWSALLKLYQESDPIRLIFGSGLGSDIYATITNTQSPVLYATRAHNSYLYLLICTGLAGLFVFCLLVFSLVRPAHQIAQIADFNSLSIASIFVTLMLIFLWTSLTTEVIIRPQLMILLFFFSGIMIQRGLELKRLMRSRYAACTSGS